MSDSGSSLNRASLKTADRSDHNSQDEDGNRTSEEQSLEADPETRNCSEEKNSEEYSYGSDEPEKQMVNTAIASWVVEIKIII